LVAVGYRLFRIAVRFGLRFFKFAVGYRVGLGYGLQLVRVAIGDAKITQWFQWNGHSCEWAMVARRYSPRARSAER